MKLFIKHTPILLVLLMAPACYFPTSISFSSTSMSHYYAAVKSWEGAPLEELKAAWPRHWNRGRIKLNNGKALHEYTWSHEYTRPAQKYYDYDTNDWIEVTPEYTELFVCKQEFTVDANGIIEIMSYGDSDCGNLPPPPARKK